ncbi:MAG TPA: hypothetical protein ENI51_02505 [Candidatus Atribacteria bacterium]|nr:hypothetical protein [Candidatus Atribacteria bacterium]
MDNKKVFLFLVIILLIIGVVATIYLQIKKILPVSETPRQKVSEQPVSQEQEKSVSTQPQKGTSTKEIDTSDWKIYRNEEYGFEIKYPKDMDVQKDTEFKDVESHKRKYIIVFIRDDPRVGCLTTSSCPYPYSFEESVAIREESKKLFPSVSTMDQLEKLLTQRAEFKGEIPVKVTIGNNIPALKVYRGSNKFEAYDFYTILRNNKVLVFSVYSIGLYPENGWKEMLSTVKFLYK